MNAEFEKCICGKKIKLETTKLGVIAVGVVVKVGCENPDCRETKPVTVMNKINERLDNRCVSVLTRQAKEQVRLIWNNEIRSIRLGYKPGEIPADTLLKIGNGPISSQADFQILR